jgi:phytoene dehydrogenase-like protein
MPVFFMRSHFFLPACHNPRLDPVYSCRDGKYRPEGVTAMNGAARTESTVSQRADVVVVGGGLAGLMAAARIARAGRSIELFEQAGRVGGRATTNDVKGVQFNMGPHALYAHGAACRLLREMQVPISGHFPSPGRPLVVLGKASYRLPASLGRLIVSRLLRPLEKVRLGRLFTTLSRIDTRQLDRTPLRAWIEQTAGSGPLALLLAALVRVSTYVDDADRLSTGVALDQLRLAIEGNVLYLDDGWQTIVDGLRRAATDHGAVLHAGHRAQSVATTERGVSVRLSGGETIAARAAILAVEPEEACRLLDLPAEAPLTRWARRQLPVPAACLDVALDQLPRPRDRFALGLDAPIYFSVHSAAARLGPADAHVLHVMKYLRGDSQEPPATVQGELEAFLDHVQPGWRSHLVARRFLPRMTVSHALPLASEGGAEGRPAVQIGERRNVLLAGDWVGPAGMLADAAAASAAQAADRALELLSSATCVIDRESVLHG